MDEKDILSLAEFKEIRVPLRFKGDEGYEWGGGFVIDLDITSDKWLVNDQ